MPGKPVPTPLQCHTILHESPPGRIDVVGGEPKCLFPACKNEVSESPDSIRVRILKELQHKTRGKFRLVIELNACSYHSHVMKARKEKKAISLQQFSHMRNALTTMHTVVSKNLSQAFSELTSRIDEVDT
jgi:hypothetical protein